MPGKDEKKISWKAEYDNGIYKIYDWNKQLAGYFFPNYGEIEPEESHEEAVEQLNNSHAALDGGGHLLVPMLRLALLDNQSAIPLDLAIESLQSSLSRAQKWKVWLENHSKELLILGVGVHTAREDRNMLSLAMAVSGTFTLSDKQVIQFLMPILNVLHTEGLL